MVTHVLKYLSFSDDHLQIQKNMMSLIRSGKFFAKLQKQIFMKLHPLMFAAL
jgi:hypothetical protein